MTSEIRLSSKLIETAGSYPSATLYEASGQQGALPSAIKPIVPGLSVCGPAFTVELTAGDNLWLHRAIYAAGKGDILVVTTEGATEAGYWGEIMTRAAIRRELGGLVIDACVRDGEALEKLKWPVFARGLCIRGTTKKLTQRAGLNRTVQIGDVSVVPGDLIVGDKDGVVVISRLSLPEVLAESQARTRAEQQIIRELETGATTLEIYMLGEGA